MKKFFLFSLLIFSFFTVVGRSAYQTINVIGPEYVTVKSTQGIVVESASLNSDKSITVILKNSNRCNEPEIATYTFDGIFLSKENASAITTMQRCVAIKAKLKQFIFGLTR